MTDTLQIAGFETHAADNGISAFDVLQNNRIDMVVSDIQMARCNGMQLLSRIKEKCPEVPVILMTAYGTIQQAVQALREGALDYLVKPFEPEVIITKLSQHLPNQSASDKGMIAADDKTACP